MNKKPKIVVVGIGQTGSQLLEALSKEKISDDMELISVAYESDLPENEDVTKIAVSMLRTKEINIEDVKELSYKYEYISEFNNLLHLMIPDDKLYQSMPASIGCFRSYEWSEIILKREGKTIYSYKIYSKNVYY